MIQVHHQDTDQVLKSLHDAGLGHYSQVIGSLNEDDLVAVNNLLQ